MKSISFAALLLCALVALGPIHNSDALAACDLGSTAGWFRLGSECYVTLQTGLNVLPVYVDAVDIKKARVTITNPPFGTVVAENWSHPHTGSGATGVEVDLEGCTPAGRIQLGEIHVLVEGVPPTECNITWTLANGEVQSCSDKWLPAGGYWHNVGGPTQSPCCAGWQVCYALPASGLYPPDGATNVSTNVVLSWQNDGSNCAVDFTSDPACGPSSVQTFTIDCSQWTNQATLSLPFTLLPSTTYYWRPTWGWYDMWCGTPRAAWHAFTTTDIVATEKTTWGQVKVRYRD